MTVPCVTQWGYGKRKIILGQALGHRVAYQEAQRWGEKQAALRCRDTFQRALGSLGKATVPGSWHMPTRWRGCPPGTSGGSAPVEQKQVELGGLSRHLLEAQLLELLKTGYRLEEERLLSPSHQNSKGPQSLQQVTVSLNRAKSLETSFSVALKPGTVVLEGGMSA